MKHLISTRIKFNDDTLLMKYLEDFYPEEELQLSQNQLYALQEYLKAHSDQCRKV